MAHANSIKLVIADVDGTLVTGEKLLTELAIQAVQALDEAGIAFAITSGRPPRGMQMLIDPLHVRTPIAGFNGGVFAKPDLSVIETRTLAVEAARAALEIIRHHGMDGWLYTADDWLVHNADAPHVARETWTVKFAPAVVAGFGDADLAGAIKIVGVSDDAETMVKAERAMQQELGAHVAAARSQPYYLDVTHKAANKGAVVDRLAALLRVDRNDIATIGDMPNDVLMFQRSGVSIAMGNASDEVKAKATEVTESNEAEGFAKAMRRVVLHRR